MKFNQKALTILACFAILCSYAQKFSKSIPDTVIKTLKITSDGAPINGPSITKDYIIEAEKTETNYFKINLISSNNKTEEFTLYPLSFDLFKSKFKKYYTTIIEAGEGITVDATTEYNEMQISLLFAQLITFDRTEEERPVVANITLRDEIVVKTKSGTAFTNPIQEASLELTFYNGYIEKVELETEILGNKVRFTNLYSIGISSSNGIKRFAKNNIHSFYKYEYVKTGNTETLIRDYTGESLMINFADIIDYDREIDINANDISPEPTRLRLDKTQKKAKLYKEESTKLFEAVVYSDFLGVFDEENPNGIIQTEVNKKFYINTDRNEVKGWNKLLAFLTPSILFSEGFGGFEYLDVSVKLSKIEENNKFLIADTLDGTAYFQPLKIKQHESFSIGADLNLLYLENQNKKINTNLDLGVRYGRSGLQLDENTQEFYNTITSSLEMGFQFIPEKRYGFTASDRLSYYEIYNDDGLTVNSLKNGELKNMKHWLNTMRLDFYVNTSSTGKLFIRYQLTHELEDWDNNFSQFQFGYSFYILRQNGKSK